MKKVNVKIILSCWIIACLASCSLLDVDTNDGVARKEIYTVEGDAYAIKSGLYNTMQGLVEQYFVLGELRGDLVTPARGAKKNPDMYQFMDHNISLDNKYLDWSGFYTLINQCNDALVSLPVVKEKTPDLQSKVYNHIMGEVLWLRSWAYLTLVKNWGDVPFITEPIYTVQDVRALAPTPEDVILDQLEKDMTWAVDRLVVNWSWGAGTSIDAMWNHETVNMCAGIDLLSEILIYRGKLEEAWSSAALLRIMDPTTVQSGVTGHEENWNNSFNLIGQDYDGGKEWFNVQFRYANERYRASWFEQGLVLAFDTEVTQSDGGKYNERHPMLGITSNRPEWGEQYIVKPSYHATLYWTNIRDINRGRGYSFYVDGTDTLIWKYVGLTPEGDRRGTDRKMGYGNIQFSRTADLYYRGAETAARLGLTYRAIEVLSQSRTRIAASPAAFKSNATIEEIEDAIMDERAAELAFEGYRWYDLVRIAKRRNDPNYLIDRVVAAAPSGKRDELRARLELQAANWWKLPYGNKAMLVNPNLKNND